MGNSGEHLSPDGPIWSYLMGTSAIVSAGPVDKETLHDIGLTAFQIWWCKWIQLTMMHLLGLPSYLYLVGGLWG